MKSTHAEIIAQEIQVRLQQVVATLALLEDGATVPFISRYRKEATGSLDEVAIAQIRDREKQLTELDDRRDTILKSIEEQGKMTPELRKRIQEVQSMSQLEDIYLPFRPKRRTRATIAIEKGLEPLAKILMAQDNVDPRKAALRFVDPSKEVNDAEEAIAGARDIIAEWINEDENARARMRRLFERKATIKTKVLKGKEEEGAKFRDYFEWEEDLSKAPSHRVLAMRRGEKEKFLSLKIAPDPDLAVQQLDRQFIKARNEAAGELELAIRDSYKRLLAPSMETEVRLISRQKAETEAINVFAENLRQLLLSSPLGQKNVLAIDPGFRTGCKCVCLDRQGKLLHNDTIFPHTGRTAASEVMVLSMLEKYKIEAIAIGNGTAGRETETFIRSLAPTVPIIMVNESGASIYSASDVAREEFPDYDVTVRGAVSIGRRLQDPLAELVKIDPKSIGVGQYQHDVDQNALKKSVDDVVESCVNKVGVEINSASKQLLTYVSGLGPSLAQNIVDHRNANGPFQSRKDLQKVSRLGDKAFEQCAGFLRIREAKNPLDASAVHPESYHIVEKMAKDLKCSVTDLMRDPELRKNINLKDYVTEKAGLPTLKDIMEELSRPGRDPREQFEVFSFAEGIESIADLHEGMVLDGIVTNITKFGAFVDIGVHQDGMVHVSELANKFVRDPAEVVKLQQKVRVKVVEVDQKRNRISLSIKQAGK